ncbi:conserved hypothetical integral membrane protein [Verrucomicrobium sp. GAS474]|uniref:YeiH family protein n=1 Tax=Verrucomicrobium sp. GAS474 TaxID=1882831 RepID=UPI000879FC67|nr:putative sulfate exporter family transporter [Verrucomicrobium sp. GAS474]SDT93603.1 conserved hypothetical integral membrane protein [Verrucomicrobium sp. GAS474]
MSTAPESRPAEGGWKELWQKEDWWAVWIGLAFVVAAYLLFNAGSTALGWIAVAPAKWSTLAQLDAQIAANAARYVAEFALFAALFGLAAKALGYSLRQFLPSFLLVYLLSLLVFAIGAWDQASKYSIEPPLLALLLGLFLSNAFTLPKALHAGFRVEFYVKTGIVLLGAGLPFTLILWAGPTALLQASIVSLATFFTIYLVGKKLGLDRRLAAILGAGGAVCGVSAAIAVSGAVRARKEQPPIAITLVVLWAIVLIFVLPFAAKALHLPTGTAGAWIGTSEFADAAGFAAVQAYGGMVEHAGPGSGITGTADQAVWSYTLIKVIGRDLWIGIWALVLSTVSIYWWERDDSGRRPEVGQIWWRFPKFVIGFLIASALITLAAQGHSLGEFNKAVKPALVAPLIGLRTWAFTFCFLSIGLTTRFRDLAPAGGRPFWAFTAGVVVNLVLGYLLSVVVFGNYWATLNH